MVFCFLIENDVCAHDIQHFLHTCKSSIEKQEPLKCHGWQAHWVSIQAGIEGWLDRLMSEMNLWPMWPSSTLSLFLLVVVRMKPHVFNHKHELFTNNNIRANLKHHSLSCQWAKETSLTTVRKNLSTQHSDSDHLAVCESQNFKFHHWPWCSVTAAMTLAWTSYHCSGSFNQSM